jgi:hypothetical protein
VEARVDVVVLDAGHPEPVPCSTWAVDRLLGRRNDLAELLTARPSGIGRSATCRCERR